MNLEDTKSETAAIESLEKAFKRCSDLGLKFSVMDNELHYANKRLYVACEVLANKKQFTSNGAYPVVAYAQNTELGYCPEVNTGGSMESCGGW